MKTYTMDDIHDTVPCYDPNIYLPEDWTGTVLDVLGVEECPSRDRLWLAVQWLDDRTNRLFDVWCAREALALTGNSDPRSKFACDTAERFANGQVTEYELSVVEDAAWAAVLLIPPIYRSAAESAAASAVKPAYLPTGLAINPAYRSAAWAAAEFASRSFLYDSIDTHFADEFASCNDAWTSAHCAAHTAQIVKLRQMISNLTEAN